MEHLPTPIAIKHDETGKPSWKPRWWPFPRRRRTPGLIVTGTMPGTIFAPITTESRWSLPTIPAELGQFQSRTPEPGEFDLKTTPIAGATSETITAWPHSWTAKLVESHRLETLIPLDSTADLGDFPNVRPVLDEQRGVAERWAEEQGVEIERQCHTYVQVDPDNTRTIHVITEWSVDVGHATEDDDDQPKWTWSPRWEHWAGWFHSMRVAAAARGRALHTPQSEHLSVLDHTYFDTHDAAWADDDDFGITGSA